MALIWNVQASLSKKLEGWWARQPCMIGYYGWQVKDQVDLLWLQMSAATGKERVLPVSVNLAVFLVAKPA